MPGLGDYIGGFLMADGFTVTRRDRGRLSVERHDPAGLERRTIWFADPADGLVVDEPRLLTAFATRQPVDARDQAFFVTPTLAGLSTEFRQSANELGVGVRAPIQFFDTPYKSDGDGAFGTGRGGEARSIFTEFRRQNQGALAARVPQPFVTLSAFGAEPGGFGTGSDLRDHLLERFKEPPDGPELTIVIGNAGAGKSYLFASLFEELSRHFATEKRALRLATRPILFLPEHIRDKQVRSMDGLLEAVAATDAAAATSPGLMRWLNANGLTLWMFDGLDEFFAGEADFLAALEQALGSDSSARILICARDSLLTTSTALRTFVEAHMDAGVIRLYELARWDRPSQRALAWLRLVGRLPGDGESSPPAVADFMGVLDRSLALSELATLPYYCDLLLSLAPGNRRRPRDEFELLELAVDALIERESEKLAAGEFGFDWDVFSGADAFMDSTDLVETLGVSTFSAAEQRLHLNRALREIGRDRLVQLIEAIAHRMRMHEPYPNEGRGLSTGELHEIASPFIDVGLLPDLEPRVVLALVQFAVFGPGAEHGHVKFAHEVIADFLAGRHALAMIRAEPDSAEALGTAVGVRRDLERSVAFRHLVAEISADRALAGKVKTLATVGSFDTAQAANVQLLAVALESARR